MKKYLLLILIILVIIFSTLLFINIRNLQNVQSTRVVSYPSRYIVSNVVSSATETKVGYKFTNYPISFSYPKNVSIHIDSSNVLLVYNGSTMRIIPDQKGLGFSEPAPEISNEPILIGNQTLIINNQSINKIKVYYKDLKQTTYYVLIPYSDSQKRGYSVMINYQFRDDIIDQKSMEVFDNIVKTIKVG